MSCDGHSIVMHAFDTSPLLHPPAQSVVLSRCANGSPILRARPRVIRFISNSQFAFSSP